jgi:hypothetical protein
VSRLELRRLTVLKWRGGHKNKSSALAVSHLIAGQQQICEVRVSFRAESAGNATRLRMPNVIQRWFSRRMFMTLLQSALRMFSVPADCMQTRQPLLSTQCSQPTRLLAVRSSTLRLLRDAIVSGSVPLRSVGGQSTRALLGQTSTHMQPPHPLYSPLRALRDCTT